MKTSKDYEQEFLSEITERTGKDLDSWMKILKGTSLSKMKETIEWLKKEKAQKHSNASYIAGIFLNDGKPVYAHSENLTNALFKGREAMFPLFEELEKLVKSRFPGIDIVPTKTYISFRDGREFAVASIKSKEIRVGLDLGDVKFDDQIQKAASLGAMPRISHMMVVREKSDLNKKLSDHLEIANKRVKK